MTTTVEVTGRTSALALLAAGRVKRGGGLPDVVLVRRDVRTDRERLAAYQQLVGEPVADAVPAGWLHTLVFPLHTALLARPDFPLPALGMVHLANRVELRRAVDAAEVLEARLRAERLAPHRRGATVDLVGELTAGDEVVWRGVSTYLAKGVRLPDGGADRAEESPRPEFVAPRPTGLWRLDADLGRRYAAVSGDRNPIHTSRLAARAFGFARPIAHGMYTAARALAEVGPERGDAYAWDVEFAAPVPLPATVSVRIAPDDGAAGGFTYTAWSRRPHLTGSVGPLA